MESVAVNEIARVLNLTPASVRKWDGYDPMTDTIALNDAEVEGLWIMANKAKTRKVARSR